MADKELLKRVISENQEFIERVDLVPRNFSVEQERGNYVFTGIRRAGKTYCMYLAARMLMDTGLPSDRILYIGFEDERLMELALGDLDAILEVYREMFDGEPVIFLDEIQNITGWEKFARRLADQKYRVFITGSNANMLSREVAGALGGRFMIKEIFPFSFGEFLTALGETPEKNWEHGSRRFAVRKKFNEYFTYGGLPELIHFKEKKEWLESLYQKIFYGDIVVRYKVRNEYALKLMIKKLAESVMADISYNRIRNIMTSSGVAIGTSTVIDYIAYLKDSYLIFEAANIMKKFAERETAKKYYFADNGVLSLFLGNQENRLLENIVACELVRRGHALQFAKGGAEVDFVLPEERMAIQVCISVNDPDTLRRECKSMIEINRTIKAEKLLIITMDEERVIEYDGFPIAITPVWKWLI